MKHCIILGLLFFISTAYSRQYNPPANQTSPNSLSNIDEQLRVQWYEKHDQYGPQFRDYEKVFSVSKSVFKDKKKIDSIYDLAMYFLVDAIKGGYHRIVITITREGNLNRYRHKIFRCDMLYLEIVGRKLQSP